MRGALFAVLVPVLAFSGTARAAHVEGPFGRGASQVWILFPTGRPRRIVVFGHGWKSTPPATPLAWVDQFRPWLEHLAARGSAVVFPRYQLGAGDSAGPARIDDYRRGLTTAFEHLRGLHVPVVVAGYSFGASLAFSFAAEARRWRLPQPAAVDAVFPAGPIESSPLPPLRRAVRVLIQVGDRDTEAGSAGASAFRAWLGAHALRYVLVRSTGSFVATHATPKETGAAARHAFWQPLDALVAGAGRTP